MRKSIIISAFLFAKIIYGQQDPSTQNANGMSNTASPNAAGFMRFQESPVNYYNGRSSFSIPIYEINVGGIKYPISLNYSQGGIQVNSMASDVGLGWSISSCFINRTIVGDADLETINRGNNVGMYKYGYFDYRYGIDVPNTHGEYLNVDFYPDLFKFVSPSGNRRFYFTDKQTPVELDGKATRINWTLEQKKYSYLKDADGIWINNAIDIEDYKDFTINTNDGISYYFQDKDINHSFVKSAENENDFFGNIKGTYPRISSWYVSKIKNQVNDEEINFTYESYSSENKYKIDELINTHPYYKYESKYPWARMDGNDDNINFRVDQGSTETDNGKYYNRMLTVQRLKKITFRGGSVEFNYDVNYRLDLTNSRALTSIEVKDDFGNIIKRFDLTYDYFYSTLQKNEFSKRGNAPKLVMTMV